FQTVPWWVRVAVEPASLLAVLLASALLWRGNALFALVSSGASVFAAWLASTLPNLGASLWASVWATLWPAASGPATDPLLQPGVLTALALALAPLLLMG